MIEKKQKTDSEDTNLCLIANKSNPILDARNILTKQQLRLFNLYLSLINPINNNTKKVTLLVNDFVKLVKVNPRPSELRKIAEIMLGMSIDLAKYEITDEKPYDPMRIHRIAMWNMFSCEKNDNNEWVITMEASQAMEPYIFDIKKLGYTGFNVIYSLNLQSENSMKLYEQVYRFRKIGVFEIKVEELLNRLGLSEKKTYQKFSEFQRTVLKPCIDDINANTDIHVSYKTKHKKKKGYPTYAIIFYIKRNENNILRKYMKESNTLEEDELLATQEIMEVNPTHLYEKYLERELDISKSNANSIMTIKDKTHTSDERMVEIIEYSKNQNPKNIVGYIIKAMEDSYNITTTKKKDYEKYPQRTYTEQDMKTLEEKLLNKK